MCTDEGCLLSSLISTCNLLVIVRRGSIGCNFPWGWLVGKRGRPSLVSHYEFVVKRPRLDWILM